MDRSTGRKGFISHTSTSRTLLSNCRRQQYTHPNTAIQRIADKGVYLKLTATHSATYQTDVTILAIPPQLATHHLVFEPALPQALLQVMCIIPKPGWPVLLSLWWNMQPLFGKLTNPPVPCLAIKARHRNL